MTEEQQIQEVDAVFTQLKTMLHLTDDIIIRLNNKFFETVSVTIEKLAEAIGAVDFEGIETNAHSIKGSSASLWYTKISEIAQSLEQSAKDKERYEYAEALKALRKEFLEAQKRYVLWKKKRESES